MESQKRAGDSPREGRTDGTDSTDTKAVREALRRLEQQVPEPAEGFGLLMLAGNGMAESFVGLRARQARLEVARLPAHRQASRAERRAEAERAEVALSLVRSEVRRLGVKEPEHGEGLARVYGHVLRDGEPVADAEVALVDEAERLVCVDTDAEGAFALSARSEHPLALEVALEGKVVHRDEEATIAPAPVTPYRVVELGDARPQRPEPKPCGDRPRDDEKPTDEKPTEEEPEDEKPRPEKPRQDPKRKA